MTQKGAFISLLPISKQNRKEDLFSEYFSYAKIKFAHPKIRGHVTHNSKTRLRPVCVA